MTITANKSHWHRSISPTLRQPTPRKRVLAFRHMTATNTDTAAHTLTCSYRAIGRKWRRNKIISAKSTMPGETYVCYEMLGQNICPVIHPGAG